LGEGFTWEKKIDDGKHPADQNLLDCSNKSAGGVAFGLGAILNFLQHVSCVLHLSVAEDRPRY